MRYLLVLTSLLLATASCSSYKKTNDYVFAKADEKKEYIKAYDKALALWDIPFEETNVETSCGLAHVIISGPQTGEPVILFHGMDASSTMWYPNVKELSKNHRIYAIDFPLETGKSMACAKKINSREIVLFYNEIFDHFKMENINLVAASRGGWMATFLALQPNNKIKKLILLSPAQTFGGIRKPGKVLTAVSLKLFPSRKKLNAFFDAFSSHPEKIDQRYKDQFFLANVYGNSRPDYISMTQFSKQELRSLKMPVLVLIGNNDIVNSLKSLELARQLVPNVETAVVPDAGHFLSIDQSEIINKKIVDFLNKK